MNKGSFERYRPEDSEPILPEEAEALEEDGFDALRADIDKDVMAKRKKEEIDEA